MCIRDSLKIQRRLFRDGRRELTKNEYERLVSTASALGKERLALLRERLLAGQSLSDGGGRDVYKRQIQKSSIISGYMLPFMTCLRELSLFMLLLSLIHI